MRSLYLTFCFNSDRVYECWKRWVLSFDTNLQRYIHSWRSPNQNAELIDTMSLDHPPHNGAINRYPSCLTSRCFDSSLGKLSYLDFRQEGKGVRGQGGWGDGEMGRTETIVFLHGFTGSSRDFLSLPGEILSQYRCLIPDLPGHGRTQVGKAANTFQINTFQTEGQVTLLRQWLNSLGQRRFHLFGYSMGGRLALQFAVRYPHLLDSLILVSTTAGIRQPELRQKRAESDLQLAQTILKAEPVDFLTRWVSQPIFQGIAERGEGFIAQEVNRRLPIQPAGLANSLKSFGSGVMPAVWGQLKKITVPVLVIAGSRDSKYLSLASELVNLMPDAVLEILDTTHAPLVESPDLLWEKVADFLSSSR